jgi:hypothetical protein
MLVAALSYMLRSTGAGTPATRQQKEGLSHKLRVSAVCGWRAMFEVTRLIRSLCGSAKDWENAAAMAHPVDFEKWLTG